MGRDKGKKVVVKDTRSSSINSNSPTFRQRQAHPSIQGTRGIMIGKPTKRLIARQLALQQAQSMANADRPQARQTTKPATLTQPTSQSLSTPPSRPALPPSQQVPQSPPPPIQRTPLAQLGEDFCIHGFTTEYSYNIEAFSMYQPIAQSMHLLDNYSLFQLMEPFPMVYKYSVCEFFATLTNRGSTYSTFTLPLEERGFHINHHHC